MNMLDQILIIKNVLTEQQCDNLIEEYERRQQQSCTERCIHAVDGTITTSTFQRVELEEGTQNYELMFQKNEHMVNEWLKHLDSFKMYNIHSLKNHLKCSHMYRLMKYEEGQWIHPHTDWTHFVHASCTFALNDDYEGGEFAFFNGNHTVKLSKGDAMIWPADCFWVHQVKPITKGVRYSTNSFICSLEFGAIMDLSAKARKYMSQQRTYKINYNPSTE